MAREKLEIKKFSEYTNDEQMEILFHWWHYYGKLPLSFPEMEKFKELLDTDIEFVKNAALIAWARESASQDLVRAMRGDLSGFRKQIKELASSKEFKDIEEFLESTFIEEVVRTYNNPEPSIPMSDEQLRDGLAEIFGGTIDDANIITISMNEEEEAVLTSDKVHKIYRECLFKEDELVNGEPSADFTIGEGVRSNAVFNAERLAKRKNDIIAMIDELPDVDSGPSFVTLCFDKHGRHWTGLHSTMDLLMQLGTATEVITYPLPRELWPYIGGVPLVLRVHGKENESLVTHKPKEFKKVRSDLENGRYKKDAK